MTILADIETELDAIRAQSLWKTERPILSPQDAHIRVDRDGAQARGPQFLRQQLSGPCRPSRAHRGGEGGARQPRPRHGLGALHLRHDRPSSRARGARSPTISARKMRSSLPPASMPMAALFEPLFGAEDAIISDSLNHASIIDGIRLSKAKRYPLRQWRHGRARDAAQGSARRRGRAPHDHRHRRRLLDGRLCRQARPRSATLAERYRRAGHGRRLPCHRLHRAAGARHAGARRRQGRHHHRHARQDARRRDRRLRRGGEADHRHAAPARAALSLLQLAAAAGRRRRAQGDRHRRERRRPARAALRQCPALPHRHERRRASTLLPGEHPDHPGDAGRGEARAGHGGEAL